MKQKLKEIVDLFDDTPVDMFMLGLMALAALHGMGLVWVLIFLTPWYISLAFVSSPVILYSIGKLLKKLAD